MKRKIKDPGKFMWLLESRGLLEMTDEEKERMNRELPFTASTTDEQVREAARRREMRYEVERLRRRGVPLKRAIEIVMKKYGAGEE